MAGEIEVDLSSLFPSSSPSDLDSSFFDGYLELEMSGEEIGIAVLVKFVEDLVSPATDAVRRQFSYLFYYKRNARNLRIEGTKLNAKKVDLEQRIRRAYSTDLETIAPSASLWLDQAQEFTIQGLGVQQRASDFENGCRINLIERYVLSRKATKLVEKIGVHIHDCAGLEPITHPALPVSIVDPSSTTNEPSVSTLINALIMGRVHMIGIHGEVGVDKMASLVEKIDQRLKAEAKNAFHIVRVVFVNQNPDLLRIQDELARKLFFTYHGETSLVARANRLRKNLSNRGRILVILVDVWAEIDLYSLGIPVSKGCKVIFTTQTEHACIQMGPQMIFHHDSLSVEYDIPILQPPRVQMRQPQRRLQHEPPVSTIDLIKEYILKGKRGRGKAAFSTEADASLISRSLAMQNVMDALMTDGVNMIGLFGMGGVGKTTLMNEIREIVKAQKLFSEMAMAEVSQHPDLFRIQGELAEKLGLNYQELTSVDARAERLRERLTQGAIKGGRVLVILDNIWGDIELDKLGIPVSKSCKVIFATRIEQTCIHMRAQATIEVSVLSNEESWNLFKKTTGDCVKIGYIEGIARKIAKECGGLPLAIVTLGKALAGKVQQHIWYDTLYQLETSAGKKIPGMEANVHKSIELSYNFLEHTDLKSLLLFCCLFQEGDNIPIERLVRYCIGVHFIDDVETMANTRGRVYSLVDYLKSSSLLLDGGTEPFFEEEMFVKVHDVVRDVCQSIASKEPLAYLVRHNQWPHNDTPNTHSAISLMSDVMNNIPGGLVYPNLKLLQLNGDSVNVSTEYFQGMKALRVLDFQEWSSGGISACLPETLLFLENLRMLSLEHCSVAKNISVIGRLRKLEVLSFFMSSLDNLPSDVGELRYLKVLDLRCKNEAPLIITSILPRLHNLEELYMGSYDSWKGTTEEEGEVYCTSITDLNSLHCLSTLQIQVPNPRLLLELDFPFEMLGRFNISTQKGMILPNQYAIVNSLYLEGIDAEWLQKSRILSLVDRTETLYLTQVEMSHNILSPNSIVKILHLERLHFEEMNHFTEILNPSISFVKLRELVLLELPALRILCSGPIHTKTFSKLTFIQISRCAALRSLFTYAICLPQLQDLFIFQCDVMEGVISDEGTSENYYITFPKLNYLWFDCLPKFGSFFPVLGIKESLLNQKVSLPNLDMLQISNLDGLRQIVGGQVLNRTSLRVIKVKNCRRLFNITDSALLLKNLENVVVEDCEEIESVFGLEGLQVTKEYAPVILSNLETIDLNNLPRLTEIWRMVIPNQKIKGLENLRTLDVWGCHSLRYILPLPIAKLLVNLHDLTLGICNSMEEVIGGKEDDSGTIVFPQLKVLKLEYLNNFISFSSSSNNLEFPSLQKTEITKCPNMTVFCSGLVKAPIVEEPLDDPDINEWMWEGNLNNGINRGSRFSSSSSRMHDSEDKTEEIHNRKGKGKVEE